MGIGINGGQLFFTGEYRIMRTICFTQLGSLKKIAVWPAHFILHKPRRIRGLPGKPTFANTTFMSVFSPSLCHQAIESYDQLKKTILSISMKFVEFRHLDTQTPFLIHPSFFEILEEGARFFDGSGEVKNTTIVSVWNPGLYVPIVETFETAINQINGFVQ